MTDFLVQAGKCSFISRLAIAQADYVRRHYPECPDEALLLILLLQYALEQGNVCLRLPGKDTAGGFALTLESWRAAVHLQRGHGNQPVYEAELLFIERAAKLLSGLNSRALQALLQSCSFIRQLPATTATGEGSADAARTAAAALLIQDAGRLYFRRYYLYEKQAADFVSHNRPLPYYEQQPERLKQALALLFPDAGAKEGPDWQQCAAAMAALNYFTIISGGPGTGKTTTVVRLLLLLTALDPARRVIELCAPTGKAAARLSESIAAQLNPDNSRGQALRQAALKLAELTGQGAESLISLIPSEAHTVHRLLKVRPHQVSISYNSDNPLPADIVVVDEVSMVDLSLFCKLISALSTDTILILLGDKDQLCSVEAGSVLGDLASSLQPGSPALSAATAQKLSFLCNRSVAEIRRGVLSDEAVLLKDSYRFSSDLGIGRLAALVNDLPPALALAAGNKPTAPSLALRSHKAAQIAQIARDFADNFVYLRCSAQANEQQSFILKLVQQCVAGTGTEANAVGTGFAPFFAYLRQHDFCLSDKEAQQAFLLLDEFRVLCSNRAGLNGDVNLNKLIESTAREYWHLPAGGLSADFPGRVVLVTRNDPILNVTNGDVGFEAYVKKEDGTATRDLRIFLPAGAGGEIQKISPLFIPDLESGFALSVHKSQGSEYRQVLFVLSTVLNPVLTKELVYTAVTRAKEKIIIAGSAGSTAPSQEQLEQDVLLTACMSLVRRESGLALRLAARTA